jgi:hypothetical protein
MPGSQRSRICERAAVRARSTRRGWATPGCGPLGVATPSGPEPPPFLRNEQAPCLLYERTSPAHAPRLPAGAPAAAPAASTPEAKVDVDGWDTILHSSHSTARAEAGAARTQSGAHHIDPRAPRRSRAGGRPARGPLLRWGVLKHATAQVRAMGSKPASWSVLERAQRPLQSKGGGAPPILNLSGHFFLQLDCVGK